jgi:Tol biopolymer transport system component
LNRQQPLSLAPILRLQIARDGVYIGPNDNNSPDSANLVRFTWGGQRRDMGIRLWATSNFLIRPDGGELIYRPYLQVPQGLFSRDLSSGKESLLAPAAEEGYYGEMQWSGDGRWLFAVVSKDGPLSVILHWWEAGQDQWGHDELPVIFFNDYSSSLKGDRLILALQANGQNDYHLYQWSGPGQDLSLLGGPEGIDADFPSVSPDGRLVVALMAGDLDSLVSTTDGAQIASIPSGPRHSAFSWSSDSQCFVYSYFLFDQQVSHMYRVCGPDWGAEILNTSSPHDKDPHYTPPVDLAWRPPWLALGAGLMLGLGALMAFGPSRYGG